MRCGAWRREVLRGLLLASVIAILLGFTSLGIFGGFGCEAGVPSSDGEPMGDRSPRRFGNPEASDAGGRPSSSSPDGSDGEIDSSSFLDGLDGGTVPAPERGAGLSWVEPLPADDLARKVIDAYRAEQGTSLVTSGYLDLKGNVWGAVVVKSGMWSDIVVISQMDGDEGSGQSLARISRLSSEGWTDADEETP